MTRKRFKKTLMSMLYSRDQAEDVAKLVRTLGIPYAETWRDFRRYVHDNVVHEVKTGVLDYTTLPDTVRALVADEIGGET